MELKNKEFNSQLSVWITATILLHILVVLFLLFSYFDKLLEHKEKINETKLTSFNAEQIAQQKAMQLKDPSVTYTLIPGKKPTNAQEDLQKTEESKIIEESKKIEQNQIKSYEKSEIDLPKFPSLKQFSTHHQDKNRKEQIDQLAKTLVKDQKKSTDINKKNSIKKSKISLQDLKLGFSNFLQEGNSQAIIQQGNSNQKPDEQALKVLTYKDQVGSTMVTAVKSHELYHKLSSHKKMSTTFSIHINRSGELLAAKLQQSCGDFTLDNIILESVQRIKLFPPVPDYIPDQMLYQNWNFHH